MKQLIRCSLFSSAGGIREGWLVALFLTGLLILLVPVLIWSQQVGRDVSMAEQAIMILIVTWVCQRLRGKPLSESTGKFGAYRVANLGLGVTIGAALMLLPAVLLFALGAVHWQPPVSTSSAFSAGLLGMFLVAVAEELLFRGFLFQRLICGLGVWPAQILIGAFFLLTHWGNPGMDGGTKLIASINIFAASLLFGSAYLRTRSLAMPIGIHWAANVTQGPVLGLGVSGNSSAGMLQPSFVSAQEWLTGGTFGLEASVPGTVVVLVALSFMTKAPKVVFRRAR